MHHENNPTKITRYIYDSWMFFMRCTPPLCCIFYVSALNAPAKVLGSRELAECTSKSLRLSQVGLNALANVLGSRERAECTTKMTRYTIVGIVSIFYALYSPLACVTVFWVS